MVTDAATLEARATSTANATATLGSLQTPESIASLIAARSAAKAAKNFAEADRIRQDLLASGIVLKDSPAGTTWEAKS